MFIKEIKKQNKGYEQVYRHHRLMESYRTERGPRQRTVLHLGHLDLPEARWKELANRIEELVTGQLNSLSPDEAIESLARHYADVLIHRRLAAVPGAPEQDTARPAPDYETVDLTTLKNERARTIGGEHVGLAMFRELNLDACLRGQGLSEEQVQLAAASVVGALVYPGSERQRRSWLQNLSGLDELLGADFRHLSNNALYRIADVLFSHKEVLENHLARTEKDLFQLQEKLVLYDLTNTYFEGEAIGNSKAKRGRSKEKRADRPLVTLGLVIDENGFAKQSRLLPGNVSEPGTLLKMIELLSGEPVTPKQERAGQEAKPKKGKTVVMDAGIATEANLAMLTFEGYDYIGVSRTQPAEWDALDRDQLVTIKDEEGKRVRVKLHKTAAEHILYCHSERREAKEQAMKTKFQENFEAALKQAAAALTKKGGTKKYDKVLERIGRLRQRYAFIAHYYDIAVEEKDGVATAVTWKMAREEKAEQRFSGSYFIRTSRTDLADEKELWALYMMLTDLEDSFRCLKSELLLQPNHHQTETRMDAHIFLTALAYHLLNSIRFKLKKHNIFMRWKTIRDLLTSHIRITTTMMNKEGQKIYARNCSEPEPFHDLIYKALGIARTPLPSKKVKL